MPAYYLEALVVTWGFAVLLAEAFVKRESRAWVGWLAAAGVFGVLVLLPFAIGPSERPQASWANWPLWNFYEFDVMATFYKGFALVATLLVLLMAIDYRSILARFTDNPNTENGIGEFFALPLFACAGMMWMASAKDLAGAFVALELVTLCFYVLVAYMRRNVGSLEAGVKYLILGALSTGFLIYGIAWIYGTSGTLSIAELHAMATDGRLSQLPQVPLLFGLALVMVAMGFKVGAVPMQIWIPDVYQGAPTPVTGFLSVASKAAGFALLVRLLEPFVAESSPVRGQLLGLLVVLAAATLIIGNFGAIPQSNVKRLLAYSSIAHAGFLLLALAAWTQPELTKLGSAQVVGFYLATYLPMTLGVFFILAQVRIHRQGEALSDFNGLGKTHPLLALAFTVLLGALAGLPLTAGFLGKWLVISLAVGKGQWLLVAIAVCAAVAGFYYYFKAIRAMWWVPAQEHSEPWQLPVVSRCAIGTLTAITIVLGFYPEPLLQLLQV